jgi:xylulokinase
MTEAALGIDVGLTGPRVCLVGADGSILARRRDAAPDDPGIWPGRLPALVRAVLDEAPAGLEVIAVAASAAGCRPILLDERLEPLLAARLVAHDPSAAPQRARLAAEHGVPAVVLADHALPTILRWREDAAAEVRRAAWVVDATGYLVGWLTGVPVMDRITRDDYVLPELEPPVALPPAQEPLAVAGGLRAGAAAELGLPEGIPVAVGTYDSYVDLDAMAGAAAEGGLLLGSTMVLAVEAGAESAAGSGLRTVALAGGCALAGWTSAAGATLEWAADRFGAGDVSDLEPGAGGLVALPYLYGERAPVWDPDARAAVVGITAATTTAELQRAFLDAVALSARDIAERMAAHGRAPARWRAGGGGVHDAAWVQATSDALGAQLDLVDIGGGAGAALFALHAIGRAPSVPVVRTVTPEAANTGRYDALLPLYRELHPSLAAAMHALGGLATSGFPARP